MNVYNWQLADWPLFTYNVKQILNLSSQIMEKSGFSQGQIQHLTSKNQIEVQIDLMVEEAINTSKIEGDYINRPDVRSSIKKRLGLEVNTPVHDKKAEGIAQLMFNVRDNFAAPLSKEMLFSWYSMLFLDRPEKIKIGEWRTSEESMQIISGPIGKETVHFEAPPSSYVPNEMNRFIDWFNATANNKEIPYAGVRAAIAHLYFESIHPFDDGNGRIGRAIVEKALSQQFGYPIILSISTIINNDRKSYYNALQLANMSNEVTPWLEYFLQIIIDAQNMLSEHINFIIKKSAFFDRLNEKLNDRQLKVIRRMFAAGIKGFEGGISAKKYMSLTQVSKATATRDLQELQSLNALISIGSGRSTRYAINLDFSEKD